MKYSLKQQDLNNWKGHITENLTRCYIRDVLVPKLEKEGWDKVIFMQNIPMRIHTRPLGELSSDKQEYYHDKFMNIKIILLSKEVYPTQELLEMCEQVNSFLKHIPDGFLFKLKRIGKMMQMKDIVSEVGISRWFWKWENQYEKIDEVQFSTEKVDYSKEFPVVTGEIETVEVKSDKGELSRIQKDEYANLVKNGYPLRLFHVEIVSFDNNHFEVKQKLIRTVNEVREGQKLNTYS